MLESGLIQRLFALLVSQIALLVLFLRVKAVQCCACGSLLGHSFAQTGSKNAGRGASTSVCPPICLSAWKTSSKRRKTDEVEAVTGK